MKKGKKVHMGLTGLNTQLVLIWAEEQLCEWGWYRMELKWPLGFHPVVDTALFFCSAALRELLFTHRLSISHLTALWGSGWLVGIPHLTEATTQAFARRARTSALGGWECSGPSLTLATSPQVTANRWRNY